MENGNEKMVKDSRNKKYKNKKREIRKTTKITAGLRISYLRSSHFLSAIVTIIIISNTIVINIEGS